MKTIFFSSRSCVMLLIGLAVFSSCSSVTDSDPISSNFGEFVMVPNFDATNAISTNLVATNTGLYLTVDNINQAGDERICRYDLNQNSILSGTWQQVNNPSPGNDPFQYYTPINYFSEATSNHDLFITPVYYAFQTPVYQTINMATGNVLAEEDAPTHDFNPSNMNSFGTIIKDDTGQDWAVFRGGLVSNSNQHIIKYRTSGGTFNQVGSITAQGSLYFTASLISTDLLALSYQEKKLFIIKPSGQIVTINLSNYYDGSLAGLDYKTKFRFSTYGTFFIFQNKVIKVDGNQTATVFHTIDITSSPLGGDFCVDNEYLFATDGIRKELGGFNVEVNIIPNIPSTNNQEIILEYIDKTNFFKIGSLETSTNPADKYIYVLGGDGRILIISKKYI